MSKIAVTKGSGNVFADIGAKNAKEHAVKAALVVRIADIITELELNQTEAAKRMGLSQPEISKILRGHFDRFSIENLMRLLTKLGQDVTIAVAKPKRARKLGRLTVVAA